MPLSSQMLNLPELRVYPRLEKWAAVLPYLLAAVLMVPRLASAHFGLLDDAVTLRTVEGIHASGWGVWDLQVGRSRPIYWLLWLVVEAIADARPAGFYLVNTLLLLVTLWLIDRLVTGLGGSKLQFLIASLVLMLSVPAIENFYTLSKSEPIQVVLILLGVYCALRIQHAPGSPRKVITYSASVAFTLLAMLAKETSAIVLPIALCWLLVAHLLHYNKAPRQFMRHYVLVALAAVGLFFIVRFAMVGLGPSEGYASGYEFTFSRFMSSAIRWGAWLLYAYPYVLPFLALPFFVRDDGRRKHLPLPIIWFGLSLLSFIPWIFVAAYYLYPAALGIALFIPAALGIPTSAVRHRPNRTAKALVLLGAGLFLLVQVNTYSAARQQLMVDQLNWEMVSWLGEQLPASSRVYVGLPFGNEYLLEVELHLQDQFGRSDLVFSPAAELIGVGKALGSASTYLLLPVIKNQILLSPRLGLDEADVVRLQDELERQGLPGTIVAEIRGSFVPVTINSASVLCPALQFIIKSPLLSGLLPAGSIDRYCRETPFIDTTRFSYGWTVIKLQPEAVFAR